MRSKQLLIISKRPNPSSFDFFLDRQIDGDDIVQLLADAGMCVRRHRDYFEPEADDDVWIAEAARNGWICCTGDKNLEKDHLEAICTSRAKMVILTDNNSGYAQWGAALITGLERISAHMLGTGPMIVRVSRSGMITKLREAAELEQRRIGIQTSRISRRKRHSR